MSKQNLIQNQRGVSLLITIIIISAVTMFIAITATTRGIDETQTGFKQNDALKVFSATDGCIEAALIKLHSDRNYNGENLNIAEVSCTISVSGAGNSRTINVSSSYDANYTREIEAVVDWSSSFQVTSWEEIND